ncbi:MAG: hypothetical protein PSY14_08945 [bacterium]|nr:hypothetical protein [bacterium]MDI1227797.1 hypothetical protein [bacterium]
MDNDKKNSLAGKARKAFNTAVLIGATLVASLSPLAAQAQTYDSPQGVAVTQTQQYQQQKPWANDREYIKRSDNIKLQSALRMRTYIAQERQREAQLNQRHMQQVQRQIQQGQRNARGGWNVGEVLTTVGNAGAAGQTYQSQIEVLRNQLEQRALTEQMSVDRQIDGLDRIYARQYPQYNAPVVTQQRVSTTQTADDGVKSPEQMREELVKAYQDATLRAAKAGKPLPSPERFGLDKNDPAVQIQKAPGQ